MLEKFKATEYAKVQPLFQGAYLTLILDSVLAGNSTGEIWVDDAAHPQTALMWDNAHIFYLVGRADNLTFNQQLGELFIRQLTPAARERGIDGFKILYSSSVWENHMNVVFPTLTLTQHPRVVYTLAELKLPNWRKQLLPGFTMRQIDQALLTDAALGNLPDLVQEIKECWPSQEHFLRNGFGFCLLGDNEIICRCTAEYVSAGKCGIGIATAEAYRQRGFAALTASAFIEYCLDRQITPYWDAWLRNAASVATAEKIGLHKIQTYSAYIGPLPA
ncbi:MAG: GNAT family N-acetyltransferase [Caldilineaceae bacterium]